MRPWLAGVCAVLVLAAGKRDGDRAAREIARHPLDPLTASEIRAAADIVRAKPELGENPRFVTLELEEPAKAEVLAWSSRQPIPRKAFVVAAVRGETREAVVDLEAKRVESWRAVPGVEPALGPGEIKGADRLVRAHPAWIAAMKKRGVEDLRKVVCVTFAAGWTEGDQERGRRLVRVSTYDRRSDENFWAHPIEGVTVTVDLDRREVLRVVDEGDVAVVPGPGRRGPDKGRRRRPGRDRAATEHARIAIDGHEVAWQRWRLHLRVDARVGQVLSMVRFEDGGRSRSVLHQAHLSELFVPYMDPAESWRFRAFLDAGEFGIGRHVHRLETEKHCPTGSVFRDATFAGEDGEPVDRASVLCLFEREPGDPLWSHSGSATRSFVPRLARELVIRSIATLGNYDYVFDWIFREEGTIRIAVGATGIALAKAVTSADEDAHGRLVAERTVAVNHDHFLSYRLDLDVDGVENDLAVDELVSSAAPAGLRNHVWTVRSRMAKRESEAKLHMSMERPAIWRLVSAEEPRIGRSRASYEIHSGHNAMSLLPADDLLNRRAGFARFTLWATPYSRGERYAAGDYPNQSAKGDGLPSWTAGDRPIESTDLVLWYTLGFHHVVRREDWPVMPVAWHGFELRPFDFFERNPLVNESTLPE